MTRSLVWECPQGEPSSSPPRAWTGDGKANYHVKCGFGDQGAGERGRWNPTILPSFRDVEKNYACSQQLYRTKRGGGGEAGRQRERERDHSSWLEGKRPPLGPNRLCGIRGPNATQEGPEKMEKLEMEASRNRVPQLSRRREQEASVLAQEKTACVPSTPPSQNWFAPWNFLQIPKDTGMRKDVSSLPSLSLSLSPPPFCFHASTLSLFLRVWLFKLFRGRGASMVAGRERIYTHPARGVCESRSSPSFPKATGRASCAWHPQERLAFTWRFHGEKERVPDGGSREPAFLCFRVGAPKKIPVPS
nr:uncharacterized protein LOC110082343 [Pogona vitticeps]